MSENIDNICAEENKRTELAKMIVSSLKKTAGASYERKLSELEAINNGIIKIANDENRDEELKEKQISYLQERANQLREQIGAYEQARDGRGK